MSLLPPPLEIIGKIVSRHGFKGDVVVDWYIDNIEINKGDFLFIVIDEKGVPFSIEEIKGENNIIHLEYINSEQDASKILGCEIGIEGELLEEVEGDWINFQVFNGTHLIGTLIRWEEYPQQTMLIIENQNSEEILIPYVEDWLIDVSEKSQVIRLNLPEGLVE